MGTTNESAYLRDRTGNRRYASAMGVIDLESLAHDRDQPGQCSGADVHASAVSFAPVTTRGGRQTHVCSLTHACITHTLDLDGRAEGYGVTIVK